MVLWMFEGDSCVVFKRILTIVLIKSLTTVFPRIIAAITR
jgi:hypothetical protein